MPGNRIKKCERCNIVFECKAGDISTCQCNALQLTLEERLYTGSKYNDCLCVDCLSAMKKELTYFKEKFIFNK